MSANEQNRNPEHYFVCEVCGADSYRRLGGKALKRGYKNRFCSKECYAKAPRRRNKVIAETNFTPVYFFKPKQPTQDAAIKFERKQITCASCGIEFWEMRKRGRSKYCSRVCAKKSERPSQTDILRKAIERGASGGERIDVDFVFNEAGWRCRACGCETPKHLRGTHGDDAPELDHIVPLSRGGAHTYENVQLLCRACNIRKSDRTMDWFLNYAFRRGGRLGPRLIPE